MWTSSSATGGTTGKALDNKPPVANGLSSAFSIPDSTMVLGKQAPIALLWTHALFYPSCPYGTRASLLYLRVCPVCTLECQEGKCGVSESE